MTFFESFLFGLLVGVALGLVYLVCKSKINNPPL